MSEAGCSAETVAAQTTCSILIHLSLHFFCGPPPICMAIIGYTVKRHIGHRSWTSQLWILTTDETLLAYTDV